jgi:hypothetical protein
MRPAQTGSNNRQKSSMTGRESPMGVSTRTGTGTHRRVLRKSQRYNSTASGSARTLTGKPRTADLQHGIILDALCCRKICMKTRRLHHFPAFCLGQFRSIQAIDCRTTRSIHYTEDSNNASRLCTIAAVIHQVKSHEAWL